MTSKKPQTPAVLLSLAAVLGILLTGFTVSQLRGDTASRSNRTLHADVAASMLEQDPVDPIDPVGKTSGVLSGGLPKLAPPPVRTAGPTPPPSFSAQVVRVENDGLTVAGLRDQALIPVRFWGIALPEVGTDAAATVRTYLNQTVAGKRVFIQPIDSPSEKGMLPVKIYLGQNLLNEQLVRTGMAHTTAHSSDLLRDAQAEARLLKRGLWSATSEGEEAPIEQEAESSGTAISATIKAPAEVKADKTVKIKVTITCKKGEVTNGIVNYEVHDDASEKIHQEFKTGQNFKPGESRTYTFEWKPARKGGFRIQAGVFGKDWTPNLYWNHEGRKIWVR